MTNGLIVKSVKVVTDDTSGKSYKSVVFGVPGDLVLIMGELKRKKSMVQDRSQIMWPAGEIVNADGTISPTKADANYEDIEAGDVFDGRIAKYATTPYPLNGVLQSEITLVVFDTESGVKKANKNFKRQKMNAHVIGEVINGKVELFETQEVAPANESYQAAPAPAPAPLTVADLEAQLRALKLATKTPKVELVGG